MSHLIIYVATSALALCTLHAVAAQTLPERHNRQPAAAAGRRDNIETIFNHRSRGSSWPVVESQPQGEETRETARFHPRRLLVRFRAGTTRAVRHAAGERAGCGRVLKEYRRVPDLSLLEVGEGRLDAALASLQHDPDVLYAEPDYVVRAAGNPDDAFFQFLWGLKNIGQDIDPGPGEDNGTPGADIRAHLAWNLWSGAPDFRIAVIDTGLDLTHPDLAANVWTNPGEIPGNGLDDDGNGWIDDVHGYNFVADSGDPKDDSGHGTHVAGTIGAVGDNGVGVAGVNWRCRIVALKALNSEGQGNVSDVVDAMEYVIDNDIKLSNNSWSGSDEFSQALYDVIARSREIGHIFVAAAGNFFGRDIDVAPVYPASFDLPNMITVAATDNRDRLGFFSSIGPMSVDLGAPGVDVLSTWPGPGYAFASGTSMATPHVTGVVALVMGRLPELGWEEVKHRILWTSRPVSALQARTLTGGVVNAAAAVGDCNTNGIPDEAEIAAGTAADCDSDGIPDECEPDCNANGVLDDCELTSGVAEDCNDNGVLDECDLATGSDADCNTNLVPDDCDLASGVSMDMNQTGVPDECEACETSSECADANPCTSGLCVDKLCHTSFNAHICDDDNPCTDNDICSEGRCAGALIPTPECAPLFSLKATKVNDTFVPAGPVSEVTLTRGDRLTVDIFLERWRPERVLAYNVVIEAGGYASASTGRLLPLVDPEPDSGAFIDRDRGDFLFFDKTVFAIVWNDEPDFYQYAALALFEDECADDSGASAYLGTLILDVSGTASGTFRLCLDENIDEASFLLDCPEGFHLPPSSFECLTVHVPLSEAECDAGVDCNGTGLWDVCDIEAGTSEDCNRNDIPDECDFAAGTSRDCNVNNVPDECDVASSFSRDCDRDGVPDECQPDCNDNAVVDTCDLTSRTSADCNRNAIPDECDIADGFSKDCDGPGNGVPDECEPDCNENTTADSCDLATGASADLDDNGIPDECQRTLHVPVQYPTIQQAIDFAEPGDLVLLADGTYSGEGNVNLEFGGKILTVRGENGPAATIIDVGPENVGFRFHGQESTTTRVEGLTVTNGLYGFVLDGAGSPIIRNCVITANLSAGIGCAPASPTIEGCVITNTIEGPGILCLWSSPATIKRCIIAHNQGGGIYCRTSDVTIDDCLIAYNTSGWAGGAIRFRESSPSISNCTITYNQAPIGTAIHSAKSNLEIRNSILWGNFAPLAQAVCNDPPCPAIPTPAIVLTARSKLTLKYVDIEDGRDGIDSDSQSIFLWGAGSISADPLFFADSEAASIVTGQNTDHRLSPGSPCIDAGDPDLVASDGVTDLEGHSRVLCGRVDIGAYEFGIGDYNCDQRVDLHDIAQWPECMIGPASGSYPAGCTAFDFEFDTDVDLRDFAAVQSAIEADP